MGRRRPTNPPNDLLRAARLRVPSPTGSGRPMSRQELADAINSYLWEKYRQKETLSHNDIGKLERGVTRWPGERRREAFRAILHAKTDAELGFYIIRGLVSSRHSLDAGRQTLLGPQTAPTGGLDGSGSHNLSRDAPLSTDLTDAPQPVNGYSYASAMRSFRAADRQVGGGHLYATVVSYLRTELGPRLFDGMPSEEDRTIFTAAAALTEMAGWMAHDAGRDEAARRHFVRALDLVKVGGTVSLPYTS